VIVTLTPNPSVDRTVEVDAVVRGAVARARGGRVDPGGKGVNIARALAAHGHPTIAVLPSGGWEGEHLAKLLADEGIDSRQVPIAGSTRANVTVAEPDGTVTKFNEPGPHLSPAEIEGLIQATVDAAEGAQWVVGCGSLPHGPAEDFYALVIDRLAVSNAKVAIDTSGAAMLESVGAGPHVMKPNLEELGEVVRTGIATLGDALGAARALQDQGVATVIASLGSDGALYVDEKIAVHAEAEVERPSSAVGAGDALLAGFLANGGHGLDAFVHGIAWAAAAVSLPGSRMPGPADVDLAAVHVHDDIDRRLPLKRIHLQSATLTGAMALVGREGEGGRYE
jgi:1-phosphofructokinase